MAHMARHEVAVRANIAFHTRQPPFDVFNVTPEQVVIEFEGREFVWHPNLEPGPEGEEWWPGVTVVVNDHNDYEEERELMHRFLSAVAYELRQPVEVLAGGGSGVADPLARPLPHANRRGFGDQYQLAERHGDGGRHRASRAGGRAALFQPGAEDGAGRGVLSRGPP